MRLKINAIDEVKVRCAVLLWQKRSAAKSKQCNNAGKSLTHGNSFFTMQKLRDELFAQCCFPVKTIAVHFTLGIVC